MAKEREEGNEPVDFFGEESSAWEQEVTQFEKAWQQGDRPHIEDRVADQTDPSDPLLKELVRVELECRLKAGETARVEEYLARFPVLTEDDRFVLKMILDERRLRRDAKATSAMMSTWTVFHNTEPN